MSNEFIPYGFQSGLFVGDDSPTSSSTLQSELRNDDSYERKTSFRLRAFFSLVLTSQLCDANGSTTLHPSWPYNAPMIALGLGSMQIYFFCLSRRYSLLSMSLSVRRTMAIFITMWWSIPLLRPHRRCPCYGPKIRQDCIFTQSSML